MANNKNNRPDHDNIGLPTALEELRDREYVQLTANANEMLKEIKIVDGMVSLVFVRTIRQHPSGEIVTTENVRETHPLAEIADVVVTNVAVMIMAAKIRGTVSITRHKFFNP